MDASGFRVVSGWPEGMVPHSGVVAQRDNDEDDEAAGFYYESRPLRRWLRGNPGTPTVMHRWTVGVPHWALAMLTVAAPVGWLYTRVLRPWHRRRTRQGRCSSCGYDLRATPGRCPECGMVSADEKQPISN